MKKQQQNSNNKRQTNKNKIKKQYNIYILFLDYYETTAPLPLPPLNNAATSLRNVVEGRNKYGIIITV